MDLENPNGDGRDDDDLAVPDPGFDYIVRKLYVVLACVVVCASTLQSKKKLNSGSIWNTRTVFWKILVLQTGTFMNLLSMN